MLCAWMLRSCRSVTGHDLLGICSHQRLAGAQSQAVSSTRAQTEQLQTLCVGQSTECVIVTALS